MLDENQMIMIWVATKSRSENEKRLDERKIKVLAEVVLVETDQALNVINDTRMYRKFSKCNDCGDCRCL